MRNIILTGFMGTGKTVVAKILAKRLNRQLLRLDEMIEQEAGKPISKIFEEDGEQHFRELESRMIANAAKNHDAIIDTGGGAIVNDDNYQNLKNSGTIFCLSAGVETILKRTKNQTHRPLLNTEDPKSKIEQLLSQREQFYKKADYSIDTTHLSVDEVVDEIIKKMDQVGS